MAMFARLLLISGSQVRVLVHPPSKTICCGSPNILALGFSGGTGSKSEAPQVPFCPAKTVQPPRLPREASGRKPYRKTCRKPPKRPENLPHEKAAGRVRFGERENRSLPRLALPRAPAHARSSGGARQARPWARPFARNVGS